MRTILGKSVQGRDLVLHSNFDPGAAIGSVHAGGSAAFSLLIGGTHGDESATVAILENFVRERLESGTLRHPTAILCVHNPDGFAAGTRYNSRGVDLNRNFPHQWSADSEEPSGAAPLSEPESLALHDFIRDHRPSKIISLHWALAEIDADGIQSAPLARHMWEALDPVHRLPYRLRVHAPEHVIQGFCPGSLGQWCGYGLEYDGSRRPAMVTLELPHHPQFLPRPETLPDDHLGHVRGLWDSRPGDYLAGVQGPAFRMLEAACGFDQDFRPGPGSGR